MKKGILASYREKFLLLKEKVLSDEQFILYDYCIHIADFDENHKGKFGTFQKTNKELAEEITWSEDKLGRNIKVLLYYELLRKNGKQTEIVDFYRFLPKNAFERVKKNQEVAYLQEIVAKIRSKIAELQEKNSDLQNIATNLATNNVPISDIVSSRVNPFIHRTPEDYRKMKEEGGYTMLTEDDMKWIDENVIE